MLTTRTTRRFISFKPLFILVLLLSANTAGSAEIEPYEQGEKPAISLPDRSGKTHNLLDYRGKVVLINFWASWCLPCIREMPELQKLKDHFADRPFEILAINVGENREKVRKFTKTIRLELPVLLDADSKTFNDWKVKTLPTSFIVDSKGHIQYRVRGDPGWGNSESLSLIDAMTPR